MNEKLFVSKDLCKIFQLNLTVSLLLPLINLNFTVKEGEFVSFYIISSGAGRTTVLNLIKSFIDKQTEK
jgi:ABC-type nitrate/sulfonate/bicarbonate transport system ATPase subunit